LSRAAKAAPELRETPFDAGPDSAPPIELSRPLAPRDDENEDEPTVAAELPKELRSWLDAERSSQTPVPANARSSNDNAALKRPAQDFGGGSDFSEESEPTLAVHSGEISDVGADYGDEPASVVLADSVNQSVDLLAAEERVAPPAEAEPPEDVLRLLGQQ